jgi:sec-independent protein translocase protein TatB
VFLFIFESIGTSELILIGIIALIFLGPRKLPQIAKTIGKTMADLRSTTNEFKETWQREVDFEDDARALRTGELDDAKPATVARENSISGPGSGETVIEPSIKEIDKDQFDEFVSEKRAAAAEAAPPEPDDLSDKRNWL